MSAHRDDEAVQRYAEGFGNLLADTGWPRMSARAFAAILASEDGRMTSAELCDRLQASPAAVSGAVRYLLQMRLATREREPGSRRDVYVVQDNFWYESMMRQDRFLPRWEEILGRLIKELEPGSQSHRRVSSTLGFLAFIQDEVDGISERWVKYKEDMDAAYDASH